MAKLCQYCQNWIPYFWKAGCHQCLHWGEQHFSQSDLKNGRSPFLSLIHVLPATFSLRCFISGVARSVVASTGNRYPCLLNMDNNSFTDLCLCFYDPECSVDPWSKSVLKSKLSRLFVDPGRGLHRSTLGPKTQPRTRTGLDPRFIWSIESGLGPVLLPWTVYSGFLELQLWKRHYEWWEWTKAVKLNNEWNSL